MKAREVCAVMLDAMKRGRTGFSGSTSPTATWWVTPAIWPLQSMAMEVVDECVGRLDAGIAAAGGTMIITADHGNLDMMLEVNAPPARSSGTAPATR